MNKKFTKLMLLLFALVVGSGSAWATAYKSFTGGTQQASTTISNSNVSNGSVGVISWEGTGCTYSSSRVNIAANGSIAFMAESGNNITKVVLYTATSSSYYGNWSSTSGTVSGNGSQTVTIDGINAGSVTITTSSAYRCTSAGYIEIHYVSAGPTVIGLSYSGTPNKTTYEAGESFDPTGLTVTATMSDNTTQNVPLASITWTPEPLTQGTTEVTGTYSGQTITVGSLVVNAAPDPDIVLDKNNKPFTSTSGSNTSIETKTLDGIEYQSYAAYIYSSTYLSFNRDQSGAYLGNNTQLCGNIKKIVIDYNSGGASLFTMYEGSSALAETTSISPSSTGTGNVTYTFSGNNGYFKLKLTTTGTYVNINSIKIYLYDCANPTISANAVTIPYNSTSGSITYTIENEPDPAGTMTSAVVTASNPSGWLTVSSTLTSPIGLTCAANNTASAKTATVRLTYTYNTNETVTKDVAVTQEGNPNVFDNISDITTSGTSYSVKGTVVATNNKGFIIGDGTGYVYTYLNSTPSQAVGDKVTVAGTMGDHNQVLQFTSSATIATATTSNYNNTPAATAITAVPDYTDSNHLSTYLQFEGALSVTSDGYFITVGGTYIQISYPTDTQVTALTALDGKTVHVKGYFAGYNTNNYFTVMLESVEEVTHPTIVISGNEIENNAVNLAYEATGSYTATVAYSNMETPSTATIGLYDDATCGTAFSGTWFTADFAENSVASLTYHAVMNITSASRTVYMRVEVSDGNGGLVDCNVIAITQAAYTASSTGSGTYTLVTSTDQLVAGKSYIIVASNNDGSNYYAMGSKHDNNYRLTVDVNGNISNDKTTITSNDDIREVVLGGSTGNWTFYESTDLAYLKGYNGGNLYNFVPDPESPNNLDPACYWTITLDEGYAKILSNAYDDPDDDTKDYYLMCNISANPKRFACYKGTQRWTYLYVKNEGETYTTTIEAHQNNNDGWYLIASPLAGTTNVMDVEHLINTNLPDFDLYCFDQASELEWQNWKNNGNLGLFNLESGKGYLYANNTGSNITLSFTGTPYSGDGKVTLIKDKGTNTDTHFEGWNLIGNPHSTAATLKDGTGNEAHSVAYYKMNPARTEITPDSSGDPIDPMNGVFVVAAEDGDEVYFTPVSQTAPVQPTPQFSINVSRKRGVVIDRAIVRFDEGGLLPKFQLNPNNTKIYITEGNQDYAVVRGENEGEMPVSFKASENGNYTLSVNIENVEMSYLHLIDNMTGADVDLLATPSYSFEARTTDYASRFRLVFSANNGSNENGNETFAYYNGSEWVISNMGEATLQVVDVMGRVLSSETVSGNANVSLNQTPGVYVIRLVNGDSVKTQKIVVR